MPSLLAAVFRRSCDTLHSRKGESDSGRSPHPPWSECSAALSSTALGMCLLLATFVTLDRLLRDILRGCCHMTFLACVCVLQHCVVFAGYMADAAAWPRFSHQDGQPLSSHCCSAPWLPWAYTLAVLLSQSCPSASTSVRIFQCNLS